MIECALLLAALLHRPPALVEAVYRAGGLDAVALVEMESNFYPQAVRREPRGHTSYGLFQIDDEWHNQHRESIKAHIAEGAKILRECAGRELATKVSHFNGGTNPGAYSVDWGKRTERKRGSLSLWLWRHLR